MQNSEMKSNRLLKNPLLTKVFAFFFGNYCTEFFVYDEFDTK